MKRLKRYRYPLIGLSLLAVLGTGWIWVQSDSTSSRVNAANFEKIKEGMTKEEVSAILGKEIRNLKSPGESISTAAWFSSDQPPWVANNTLILIVFDENDQVKKTYLTIQKRSWKGRFRKYLP